MSKLNVGDRVKVYGNFGKHDGCLRFLRGEVGVVTAIVDAESEVFVKLERNGGWEMEVHPKQCRKIKRPRFKVGDEVQVLIGHAEYLVDNLEDIYLTPGDNGKFDIKHSEELVVLLMAVRNPTANPLKGKIVKKGDMNCWQVEYGNRYGTVTEHVGEEHLERIKPLKFHPAIPGDGCLAW